MKSRSCLIAVGGLLLAAGLVIPARAKEPVTVSLQTVHLPEPIEGYREIELVGELDGKGTLVLDSNMCSLNEFGDHDMCQLAGPPHIPVTITDTKEVDPKKRGRTLYLIENQRLPNPLFLVVSSEPNQPPRLIYKRSGGKHPVVITLEPLPDWRKKQIEAHGKKFGPLVP